MGGEDECDEPREYRYPLRPGQPALNAGDGLMKRTVVVLAMLLLAQFALSGIISGQDSNPVVFISGEGNLRINSSGKLLLVAVGRWVPVNLQSTSTTRQWKWRRTFCSFVPLLKSHLTKRQPQTFLWVSIVKAPPRRSANLANRNSWCSMLGSLPFMWAKETRSRTL